MFVPLPADSAFDVTARVLADRMQISLGQPVIVENVTGAAGSVGTGRVARAAPDGYQARVKALTRATGPLRVRLGSRSGRSPVNALISACDRGPQGRHKQTFRFSPSDAGPRSPPHRHTLGRHPKPFTQAVVPPSARWRR
jgi:hypothetical protein